jgi:hypothetical protein
VGGGRRPDRFHIRTDRVEADWDDESGQVEVRVRVGGSSPDGLADVTAVNYDVK